MMVNKMMYAYHGVFHGECGPLTNARCSFWFMQICLLLYYQLTESNLDAGREEIDGESYDYYQNSNTACHLFISISTILAVMVDHTFF